MERQNTVVFAGALVVALVVGVLLYEGSNAESSGVGSAFGASTNGQSEASVPGKGTQAESMPRVSLPDNSVPRNVLPQKHSGENEQQLTTEQEGWIKSIVRASQTGLTFYKSGIPTVDPEVVTALVRGRPEFGVELLAKVKLFQDEFERGVKRRDSIAEEIYNDMLAAGNFEKVPVKDGFGDPKRGEFVRASTAWDPEQKKDMITLVRIYPGHSPELDAERARIQSAVDMRRQVVFDEVVAETRRQGGNK